MLSLASISLWALYLYYFKFFRSLSIQIIAPNSFTRNSIVSNISTIMPTAVTDTAVTHNAEIKKDPKSKSSTAAKPRKRFVGSKAGPSSKRPYPTTVANQIPSEIVNDSQLNAAIKQLPTNYSFEIHKTIHHVRKNNAKMVALQMPEGLQMFACTIADIIEKCADNSHYFLSLN